MVVLKQRAVLTQSSSLSRPPLMSALLHFAPRPTTKKYRVKASGPHQVITRRIGASLLWFFAMSWCLVFNTDYTLIEAYAVGALPFIIDGIGSWFSDEPKRFHFSAYTNNCMLLHFVLSVAAARSRTDDNWQDYHLQFSIGWWLVHAVSFSLLPRFGATGLWEIKDVDDEGIFLFRMCGFCCATNATVLALLYQGMDPVHAFGYGFAVQTVGLAYPFLMNVLRRHGTNDTVNERKGLGMVEDRHCYVVVCSLILTVMMLQGSDAVVEEPMKGLVADRT